MPFTSPKMALRVWNLLTDLYDHTQLADNMMRIDQHDHTPGRGVQIPTEGIADGAVTNSKLSGTVTATPVDGSVTLAKLGSDVSSVTYHAYKLVAEGGYVSIPGGQAAATWLTSPNGGGKYTLLPIGTLGIPVFKIDPADWGSAPTLRVRAICATYGAAQTTTLTAGLYQVASMDTGGLLSLNTVTTGSTVAFASQGNGTLVDGVSTEFTCPSAAQFVLGVLNTGVTASSCTTVIRTQLQMRV